MPIAIGTGLITLDVVLGSNKDNVAQTFAGGTCGNVLTILSYLKWNSYPLARLTNDSAATHVVRDLRTWNVKLDFISLEPSVDTPIIIQEVKKNLRGEPYPKYSLTCPSCGAWLPTYRAVLSNTVKEIFDDLPVPQVFFFDRLSRGALDLARRFSEQGSLIYFEPSGVGNEAHFQEAVRLSHIVKYADDRGRAFHSFTDKSPLLLEIETCGKEGLKYRSSKFSKSTQWKRVASFPSEISDTAGAGDWFSAGLISSLGSKGLNGLISSSSDEVLQALQFSQALASWSCGFRGARGGMYENTRSKMLTAVKKLLANGQLGMPKTSVRPTVQQSRRINCPSCFVSI